MQNSSAADNNPHYRPRRQRRNTIVAIGGVALVGVISGWGLTNTSQATKVRANVITSPKESRPGAALKTVKPKSRAAQKIVMAARRQIGTVYDARYFSLSYPNGDVPRGRGACTDVVIRALRATGHDLQRLIHEDMRRNFHLYPRRWGLKRTDKNIDHRRVPNQMTFFARHGKTLSTRFGTNTKTQWQPGDIVCWKFENGLDHTGIISDIVSESGRPLVIHNLGVCAEEDVLQAWKITGHFRYP